MYKNIKPFLYKFDFIGLIPEFRILNNNRYKSFISSLLSILIVLLSFTFGLYSIIDYIIYSSPSISYLKKYDVSTNRTILLKDSLFMFKIHGYCNNNISDEINDDINYTAAYMTDYDYENLKIEPCELGKNINLKFKKTLEEYEKDLFTNFSISDYFCISFDNKNYSLFYNPKAPYNRKSYIQIFATSLCNDFHYFYNIITENDIIDNNNKKNPIAPQYYNLISPHYSKNENRVMNYQFEFIKYESDNGILFQNFKTDNAIVLSDISYEVNISNEFIGSIKFGQSEKNYSYFRRAYKKIQSELAEIMSVISLMLEIGKIISYFLLEKKMSKDIVENIINKNNKINNQPQIRRKNIENKLFKNFEEKKLSSDNKIDLNNEKSNTDINLNKNNLKNKDTFIKKNKKEKSKIIKKINFCEVLKSCLCYENNKTKLINLCDELIKKDLCLERILNRLYKLEKIYISISDKKYYENSLDKHKKFKKIYYYLDKIYYESKKEMNTNKKNEIEKKQNE